MARDQACVFIRESYGLRSFCFGTAQMDKLYCVMRNDEAWHPLETANNSFHGFRWLKCKHGTNSEAKHTFSWNGDSSKWFTWKLDHYNTEFEAKRRPKSAQVLPRSSHWCQNTRKGFGASTVWGWEMLWDVAPVCHVTTRIASIFLVENLWQPFIFYCYRVRKHPKWCLVDDALWSPMCCWQISKQPVTTVAQNEESLLKQILLI